MQVRRHSMISGIFCETLILASKREREPNIDDVGKKTARPDFAHVRSSGCWHSAGSGAAGAIPLAYVVAVCSHHSRCLDDMGSIAIASPFMARARQIITPRLRA